MRKRCGDKAHGHSYHDYYARGIRVCDEWQRFEPFRDWAVSIGWARGMTIDRVDNDGDYSPGNCRIATTLVQNRNSRHNRMLTAYGMTQPMSVWAEDVRCCVPYSTLGDRIRRGWDIVTAMTTPRKVESCQRT
jgi:hypothetical protein